MKRQAMRLGLAAVALLLGTAPPAPAATITSLFNTGVDKNGAVLPKGSKDPHYTVSPGSGPFIVGNWEGTATSAWLCANPEGFPGEGTFTYTTTFDLTGFDPSTARISGAVAADDGVTITLNGTQRFSNPFTGSNAPWASMAGFTIDSGCVAGLNTLTFSVPNTSGPSGLHVQLAGTAEAGVPDLMIRDFAGDNGEPHHTGSASPDIEIKDNRLLANQDNPITVRVRNRGTGPLHQAAIDLYRTPLSSGPPYDLDLRQPSVDIHPADARFKWVRVGRNALQDVAPGQQVESRFVVRPPVGETHMCFLVVIHSDEDPFQLLRSPPERLSDIMTVNNNLALKNYSVIDLSPPPQPAESEIAGRKWDDLNGNGQREPDEPGIAGVTIYLDVNGNGAPDAGEPTTTTNEQGQYRFVNLLPGRYTVREVIPSGSTQTFPGASGRFGGPPYAHARDLGARMGAVDINFGNQGAQPPPTGQITGLKWTDTNGNGTRDPDELGLAGVTIYLDRNGNGSPDPGEPTAITSADDPATPGVNEAGQYRFSDLQPGRFTVREVVPGGSTQSFPGAQPPGGGPANVHVVEVVAGQTVANINFGNREGPITPPPPTTGEITGIKWRDRNGNGTREPDEPGIGLAIIYLDLNGNAAPDPDEPTARTAIIADAPEDVYLREMGRYHFRDLKPGRYTVREVVPSGSTQTFPGTARTPGGPVNAHVVEVASGQVVNNMNFGNQETPKPPPPLPPPPPAITFRVTNQDRCQPRRVELVIDARRVPEGARVALVLPGVDHSITVYNLRPGSVSPDQLERPSNPGRAEGQETNSARPAVASVPAFYLIPGRVARVTDILVLPMHAVAAQLVVAEGSGLAPGAAFEIRVEQREDGCYQGEVMIGVRMARQ